MLPEVYRAVSAVWTQCDEMVAPETQAVNEIKPAPDPVPLL